MSFKQRFNDAKCALYNKVWHSPKRKLSARLKDACDAIPEKKRLKVVTAMLAVFVLVAIFVFGNACYKMGARQQHRIEVKHIQSLDLPQMDKAEKISEYSPINAYSDEAP